MKNQTLSRARMRRIKMFELKKEKIELADDAGNRSTYDVVPLTGEYLEDLYYIMDKLQGSGDDAGDILKVLGTDAVTKLHRIILATLKLSYPSEDETKLDQFVSQNLIKLIEPIMKVNMPNTEED